MAVTERPKGTRPVVYYQPGQMIVVVQLAGGADRAAVHGEVGAWLGPVIERARAGRVAPLSPGKGQRPLPAFTFRAPGRPDLAFLLYALQGGDPYLQVKHAVDAVNDRLDDLRRQGVSPVAAMPNWLSAAQQDPYDGGSPGSQPRPLTAGPPAGKRWYHYAPALGQNLRAAAERAADQYPTVVVLDTAPDWEQVRKMAERVQDRNALLPAVVAALDAAGVQPLDATHAALLEGLRHFEPLRPEQRVSIADHGLFVAGLVHDQAPSAPLRLVPVLNDYGIGDFGTLLHAVERLLAQRKADQPLVLNLSLGFATPYERLAAAWFGLKRPDDKRYVHDPGMQTPGRDECWAGAHLGEVSRTVELLHAGIRAFAEYLHASDCLIVAAAGNDSADEVEAGLPRSSPRIPARYDTVLGVAATARDPHQPARYSNVGDEWAFGDGVATFGGDAVGAEPRDGVIGVYSAERFPNGAPNRTGWAQWSGTSFATPLISGIAATYWAAERAAGRNPTAADVLRALPALARAAAPDLRTPAISVDGAWQ